MSNPIVQVANATGSTGTTVVSLPSAVTAGNAILIGISHAGAASMTFTSVTASPADTVTTLSAYTQLTPAGGSGYNGIGFYLIQSATGGTTALTANTSAVGCTIFAAELSTSILGGSLSLDLTSAINSGISSSGTATAATNSLIPTTGDLLLALANSQQSVTLSAWANSFTQIDASGAAGWSYLVPSSNTSISTSTTMTAAAIDWAAQLIALKITASGSLPTVTSVNSGASIAEGATAVPVVGTNFDNTVTVNILQPGGVSVAQTGVVYNSPTSLLFNLVVEPGSGDQLAFTDSTYTTNLEATTTTGGTSAPFAITVSPPTGLIFQTLASINPTVAYDITAIPGLAAGDQLEASGNSAGTAAAPSGLTLGNDATFYFTAGNTPVNFWVRAYDGTNKVWGNWALQNVEGIMAFYFQSMGVIPLGGAQY